MGVNSVFNEVMKHNEIRRNQDNISIASKARAEADKMTFAANGALDLAEQMAFKIKELNFRLSALEHERDYYKNALIDEKAKAQSVSESISDVTDKGIASRKPQVFLMHNMMQTYLKRLHPDNTPWTIAEARQYNTLMLAGFITIYDLCVGSRKMLLWTGRILEKMRNNEPLPKDILKLLENEAKYHGDLNENNNVWNRSCAMASKINSNFKYASPLDTLPTQDSIDEIIPIARYMQFDALLNEHIDGTKINYNNKESDFLLNPINTAAMGLDKILIPNRLTETRKIDKFY